MGAGAVRPNLIDVNNIENNMRQGEGWVLGQSPETLLLSWHTGGGGDRAS